MAGVLGDRGDDEVADLAGELVELVVGQAAQVRGLAYPFEEHRADATG